MGALYRNPITYYNIHFPLASALFYYLFSFLLFLSCLFSFFTKRKKKSVHALVSSQFYPHSGAIISCLLFQASLLLHFLNKELLFLRILLPAKIVILFFFFNTSISKLATLIMFKKQSLTICGIYREPRSGKHCKKANV